MNENMDKIIKIIFIIIIIVLIIFAPEIRIYNTEITEYNYQEIIQDVYTSKISDNKKTVIMTKLIMNYNKYIGQKIKDLI